MVYRAELMNSPIVCSICIANYNGELIISDCLDSVISQNINCNFEIIVHDDASTDKSAEIIQNNYPQVKLIASAENVGFCRANNRMAKVALGKYILLLNNDATLFPDALNTLLTHAEGQRQQGILTLPQYDWETAEIVDRGCLLDLFFNPIPNKNKNRLQVATVIGACLWVPNTLWTSLGGLPEWMESIGEDLYLCTKARTLGFSVQSLPLSGYRHRQGYSFGGNKPIRNRLISNIKRRSLSERNKTYVMFLFTPLPILILLLPVHFFALLFEGLLMAFYLRRTDIFFRIYMNTFTSIVKNFFMLIAERNSLRKIRAISTFSFLSVFRLLPQKIKLLLSHGFPKIR